MMLALGLLSGSPVAAQDLPFLRDYRAPGPYRCPGLVAPPTPSAEERAQVAELTSSSDQAMMLGDLSRAAALLDRATELDPASAELAYRHARVLEDLARVPAAVDEYCRALELAPDEGTRDARTRLEYLVARDRATLPGGAIVAFGAGLSAADRGALSVALTLFERAAAQAPTWASAEYNRGAVLARQGRGREATTALLRYLELRPDAPDAIAVLQRVGQLQSLAVRDDPRPDVTVALGVLLPGMGHFYAGRPIGGFTVLALAGGALAAGYLVKEVDIRCLTSVPSGQRCPESDVVSRRTDRPYLALAVGAAAAAGVIGAIEAFFDVRGRRAPAAFSPSEAPGPTLEGPAVSTRDGRVELSMLRLRLR
jgi:tetratricopeptide (TPR) repeat protein